MRPRRETRATTLEVRAFYSIAELARAASVTTFRLLRLLRRNGVTFLRVGRSLYVPLSEIRSKVPPLWDGLRAAEELREAARQAVKSTR